MAKADAAYERFRQEQDAAQLAELAAEKDATEERACRKEVVTKL
jgi:translation initiation factor 2 alpha subunit (eIF-2alpha)